MLKLYWSAVGRTTVSFSNLSWSTLTTGCFFSWAMLKCADWSMFEAQCIPFFNFPLSWFQCVCLFMIRVRQIIAFLHYYYYYKCMLANILWFAPQLASPVNACSMSVMTSEPHSLRDPDKMFFNVFKKTKPDVLLLWRQHMEQTIGTISTGRLIQQSNQTSVLFVLLVQDACHASVCYFSRHARCPPYLAASSVKCSSEMEARVACVAVYTLTTCLGVTSAQWICKHCQPVWIGAVNLGSSALITGNWWTDCV